MTESEIKGRLKDWIIRRAKVPAGRVLADDTPILASGLLSSLDVVELILFIESLRGDEVDTDAIEPSVLTNVQTLHDGFFRPGGSMAATRDVVPPAASAALPGRTS